MAKEVWGEDTGENAMAEHAASMVFSHRRAQRGLCTVFQREKLSGACLREQVGVFNVTFEPGCRNNWHIHHAKTGGGQLLICVAGRGFYQEWGKAAVEMLPGDVVNIPAGVKHWHGAAPDSWFSPSRRRGTGS